MRFSTKLVVCFVCLSLSFAYAQDSNEISSKEKASLSTHLKTVADTVHELLNKQKSYLGSRLKMLQVKPEKNH